MMRVKEKMIERFKNSYKMWWQLQKSNDEELKVICNDRLSERWIEDEKILEEVFGVTFKESIEMEKGIERENATEE